MRVCEHCENISQKSRLWIRNLSLKGAINTLASAKCSAKEIDYRLMDFTPKTNIKDKINDEFARKFTRAQMGENQAYPDDENTPRGQAYMEFENFICAFAINKIAK